MQNRVVRHRLRTVTVAALAASLPLALGVGASAQASVPAPSAGFTTVFSDDFAGASGTGLNTANWLYDTGHGYAGGAANWGTGEIENNTTSTANVYQDGAGHLAIKPIRDGAGNWTSGRIETQRTDLAAPVGGVLRMEASIQQPNVTTSNGAGYWPAFWMLGAAARPSASTNWPSIGEVDTLEGTNGRSDVFQTMHCGTASGGPCNETNGLGTGERACNGCQTAFHTYAAEVDRSVSPEQVRYYLDGNLSYTINANQMDATTWSNAVDHGFFLILNVAMGGSFPSAFGGGPFASTASGVPMLVDYVSVSTKSPSSATRIVGPGGKCVDVAGDNTGVNLTGIQLWDCQSTATDQLWTWNGSSLRTLNRCLDIASGGTTNGTQIQLYDCNGSGAQQWQQRGDGSMYNPASGRCLDSPAGSTANGARLEIWDCNGSSAQVFRKQ